MMNFLGFSTPSYRRIAADGPVKGSTDEADAYASFRRLALSHAGVNHRSVDDFLISFYLQTATFTNPSTGQKEEVDIKAIEDPAIQKAWKDYVAATPGARDEMVRGHVHGGCRGDLSGKVALQRSTRRLKKLSGKVEKEGYVAEILKKYEGPEKRAELLRRFTFLDRYIAKWEEMLSEKIEERQTELNGAGENAPRLLKELNELRKQLEELKGLDKYALYKGLEYYNPTATRDESAAALEQAVIEDLGSIHFSLLSYKPGAAESTYAKDVAGLLYQDRSSYAEYKDRAFPKENRLKKENICDILLREAVDFASRGPNDEEYSAEGIRKSVLFNGMSEGIKQELQDALSSQGILTHHQMLGRPDPAVFEGDDMDAAIEAQEEVIEADLTLERIPAPPAPSAGLRSFVETGAMVTVLGGAALALGSATGMMDPSYAINRAMTYLPPQQIIGGLALIDSVRNGVINFVCPTVRNPHHRRPESRLNKKRMVIALSTAAATAYMSQLMWNAVNDDARDGSYAEQAGEQSLAMVQWGASAANYVWNNAFVPVPIASNYLEGSSVWQGYMPTILALTAAKQVVNWIPGGSYIAEPLARAGQYVGTASNVVRAATSPFVERAKNYTIQRGVELLTSAAMWWHGIDPL